MTQIEQKTNHFRPRERDFGSIVLLFRTFSRLGPKGIGIFAIHQASNSLLYQYDDYSVYVAGR